MLPVRQLTPLAHRWQVPERPAAVLAEYRNAVARARSDDERDLALARQFVLPGRCVWPVMAACSICMDSSPVRVFNIFCRCLQLVSAQVVAGRLATCYAIPVHLIRLPQRRILFLRPMKGDGHPRKRAADYKHAKYEPVWITCDDIAAEGILVSSAQLHCSWRV